VRILLAKAAMNVYKKGFTFCSEVVLQRTSISDSLESRAEIHQALLSLSSLLAEFLVVKVPVKD
jgi:hypothetical protein